MNTNGIQDVDNHPLYTNALSLDSEFLNAIQESYAAYVDCGPRSSEKLKPLHQWVGDKMQELLGEEYDIHSLRKDTRGGEKTIPGQYYEKTVDVSICKSDVDLGIISIKFITSNFKQNANNYFEHLMGETANLRRKNIVFGHLMVIPNEIPYFKRDGTIKNYETLSDGHLQKYIQLAQDIDYPHRPDAVGITIISLPLDDLQNFSGIELQNIEEMSVGASVRNVLNNQFSVTSFMYKMKRLIEEKQ